MSGCWGCDQQWPLTSESGYVMHVHYTWSEEQRPKAGRGKGAAHWPWKYRDLMPCAAARTEAR